MDRTENYAHAGKLNQAANGAPPQRPATDIDSIEDTLSLACTIASRIQILADHLLGCTPECGATCKGEEIAGGVLPRLAQSANETRRRLVEASNALDRMQSSLS